MATKIPVTTIDTGIPTPERSVHRYPISKLNVGESFLFPIAKRNSVQSAASRIGKEQDREYTVRKVDNDNGRVWRVR